MYVMYVCMLCYVMEWDGMGWDGMEWNVCMYVMHVMYVQLGIVQEFTV